MQLTTFNADNYVELNITQCTMRLVFMSVIKHLKNRIRCLLNCSFKIIGISRGKLLISISETYRRRFASREKYEHLFRAH